MVRVCVGVLVHVLPLAKLDTQRERMGTDRASGPNPGILLNETNPLPASAML